MDKFFIQLTKPAAADLDAIPAAIRKLVLAGIRHLEQNPFADGSSKKKLKGFPFPVYRLRTGDFRAIYRINQDTVTILRVINRKELERVIKRLRKGK